MSQSRKPICQYCGERHWVTEKGEYADCYREHRRNYYHQTLKTRTPLPLVPDGYKRCTKCERILAVERFHRCKSKRDGRESWCKDCSYFHKKRPRDKRTKAYREMREKRNAYMREWRNKKREHANAYQSAYHRRRRLERVLRRVDPGYA